MAPAAPLALERSRARLSRHDATPHQRMGGGRAGERINLRIDRRASAPSNEIWAARRGASTTRLIAEAINVPSAAIIAN